MEAFSGSGGAVLSLLPSEVPGEGGMAGLPPT